MLKIISLMIFTLFSNLNSMLEEKIDYETKNELESLDWQKPEKVDCTNRMFNRHKYPIQKIYKLSNRKIAITFAVRQSEIKIFDIDSKKHLKTLPAYNHILYLQEIPKNRLIAVCRDTRNEHYMDIKIWDIKSYKLLKKFIFNFSEDMSYLSYSVRIVYLNNEKLLVIFPKKAICTIDLESWENKVSKTNIEINNIRKFNNGGFVAHTYSPTSIYVFDESFNITDAIPFSSDIHSIEILNDNEFIVLSKIGKTFIYNVKNQKIIELNTTIIYEYFTRDITDIILGYLDKDSIDKLMSDSIRLNNFKTISNNFIINHCRCHEHIRLCKIQSFTLQLIKEINIRDLIDKMYKKRHLEDSFIVFEDNTIVLQGWNDIFICRPTQNQNS